MRALLGYVVFCVGCYAPDLAPCAVRCETTAPCPGALTCGPDQYCHGPGDSRSCAIASDAEADAPPSYTLAISKTGTGTGNVIGDGIACGAVCSTTALEGTTVTFAATADGGSRFAGFGGECAGQAPCSVVLDSDKTIEADFARVYTVTVMFAGTSTGQVVSTPAGIDCKVEPCSADFDAGTSVKLTAIPKDTFGGWSGACSGTSLNCTKVVNSALTVTATFN